MRAGILLLCIVCVVMRPSSASAYRPFDSTDADVAGPGEFEFEVGPVESLRSDTGRLLFVPSLVANLGIAEGWEAVLQGRHVLRIGGSSDEARERLIDTGLFFKTVLHEGSLQEKSGPSLATEFGLLLPTLHEEPGTGIETTLILSQRWPAATLHLNLSAAETRRHHGDLFEGVIVEGPFRWPVRPVGEFFHERESPARVTRSGLIGLIWRLRENLSLDAGLRRARVEGAEVREIRAGFTWGADFPPFATEHRE